MRDAVEAIKKGASDFITKPFHFDELMHVIQTSIERGRLRSENAYLRSQLEERYQFEGIIGRSRAMQPLFSMLETVARTASTVLVTGETGTGKEVIAKAIHHNSPRKAHRFVARQLRRVARDAARERALRPREGRVHRRGRTRGRGASSWRTKARCSSTRSGR